MFFKRESDEDWACNLKNKKRTAKKKNYDHIEKLNLPCRYFCPLCALRLFKVYAHLLVHSYSLVKPFMLILWCKGSDVNYLFVCIGAHVHKDSHTRALICTRAAHTRHKMHDTYGHSAILCWHRFFLH